MSDVVSQDLEGFARLTKTKVPAVWSAPGDIVDIAARDRKVTFFKIKELSNAWARVYNEYIEDAIWKTDNVAAARMRLEEITRAFDKAMTELGPVIFEHQKVVKRLEALHAAVRRWRPKPGLQGEKLDRFLARRRPIIRRRAADVMRGIEDMADKAANPAWLKRNWQKLWGQVQFVIDKDDEERFKVIASSAASGLSRMAAKKLNMDDEVVAAFATLRLSVWATETEMLERYTYLIKIYHPDSSTGDTKMCAKINAARDTLLAHYAPLRARTT
jgi:hypothetical protein